VSTKVLVPLIILGIIIIAAVLIASGVFYVVHEGEQVVITQFGEPIGQPITTAGLKVKTPFIQEVHRFEKRLLEWDGSPDQVSTLDKRFIRLDTTARWRIVDALKYYQTLGREDTAQARLDNIIDAAARDVITSHLLIEAVRDTNRILDLDLSQFEEGQETQGSAETLERIEIGREEITRRILQNAQDRMPELGIEIVEVRIKRINYVDEVRAKVFTRMKAERMRIAAKYRSEGEGEAARIMGEKLKELELIESEAYKKAEQLKGDADAEAIRIYAEAHNKDPEFYAFIQTLATYSKANNENTRLILTTESDLYKYLKSAGIAKTR